MPSGLQSLACSSHFNQHMEKVTLLSGLQNLAFGSSFNQNKEKEALPRGLQHLTYALTSTGQGEEDIAERGANLDLLQQKEKLLHLCHVCGLLIMSSIAQECVALEGARRMCFGVWA